MGTPKCRSGRNVCALALLIAAAVLCVATAFAGSTSDDLHSGIEGVAIWFGSPAGFHPKRPYEGEIEVWRTRDRQHMALVNTDADGRFKVVLPPGTYFITQVAQRQFPRIHSANITVHKDRFTKVDVEVDSGVR